MNNYNEKILDALNSLDLEMMSEHYPEYHQCDKIAMIDTIYKIAEGQEDEYTLKLQEQYTEDEMIIECINLQMNILNQALKHKNAKKPLYVIFESDYRSLFDHWNIRSAEHLSEIIDDEYPQLKGEMIPLNIFDNTDIEKIVSDSVGWDDYMLIESQETITAIIKYNQELAIFPIDAINRGLKVQRIDTGKVYYLSLGKLYVTINGKDHHLVFPNSHLWTIRNHPAKYKVLH